jgi:hypothetical protein
MRPSPAGYTTSQKGARTPSSSSSTLFTDFENFTKFKPDPRREREVNTMLDQVIAWGRALKKKKYRSADFQSAN